MEKKRKTNKKSTKSVQASVQPPKKKTVRNSKKLPGLEKRFFSRKKQEYHDIEEYIKTIDDPKVLRWMNNFIEEWLGARLNHPGRKFHKSKKNRKRVFDANNARNRDMMSEFKKLDNQGGCLATAILDSQSTNNPEDSLIELLDLKKSLK
jgi:hypothetical protein